MTVIKTFGGIADGTPLPDQMVGFGDGTVLRGGAGDDLLVATYGRETLVGGQGSDVLVGGTGVDLLVGGDAGVASSSPDTMVGGSGADTFYVENSGDVIYADKPGDTALIVASRYGLGPSSQLTFVRAYEGDHRMDGNSLGQRFVGSTGNDTINGGGGSDSIAVGTGFNIVEVGMMPQHDILTDFRTGLGLDRIDVAPRGITAANFDASVHIVDGPAAWTVTFAGSTDTVRVLRSSFVAQVGDLSRTDFLVAPAA